MSGGAEIQAALQALNAEVQRLREREQVLTNQVNQLQSTGSAASAGPGGSSGFTELIEAQKELTNALKSREQVRLVDNRGLGKPDRFDGDLEKFLPWRIKTTSYLCSIRKELREVLQWSEERDSPIKDSDVRATYGPSADPIDQIANIEELRRELYDVLLMVTEKEPFDLVLNSSCGFEAWRKLSRRFDPTTGGRKRALLNAILTPNRAKIEDLPQALEKLLDSIRLYERRRDSTGARTEISDDIKISVIERLVPVELEKHLVLNRDRYTTFSDMLNEIQSYVEHQTGSKIKVFNSQGRIDPHGRADDPMDVGAFGKGSKGSKGKGKGGKGKSSKDVCYNCGKPGHMKADCWAPGGGKANSNGSKFVKSGGNNQKPGNGSKGSSKGKKGKGKGKKGKGKGKPVNNVEEGGEPEEETWETNWEEDHGWQPETETPEKNHLSLYALGEGDDGSRGRDRGRDRERSRRRNGDRRRRRHLTRSVHRDEEANADDEEELEEIVEEAVDAVEYPGTEDESWGPWEAAPAPAKAKPKRRKERVEQEFPPAVSENPSAASSNPTGRQLQQLLEENRRLRERLDKLERDKEDKETRKPTSPKASPKATPRAAPAKPPRLDSYNWDILPREEWAAMRFRDRRAFKDALRKQLPRGTVGEARLADQGEECSTCDERTPRITAAAAKYARRRYPNLAKKASPGTYHGTYDADDGGEEVPSVSGVAGPPTKKAKSAEGKAKAPVTKSKPKAVKAVEKKESLRPPEPAKPPAAAKKAKSPKFWSERLGKPAEGIVWPSNRPPPPPKPAKTTTQVRQVPVKAKPKPPKFGASEPESLVKVNKAVLVEPKGSMRPPEPKNPPKKATGVVKEKTGMTKDTPKAKAKAKAATPTTVGNALVSILRGTLATELREAIEEEGGDATAARDQIRQLQQRTRRSIQVTEENLADSSFHDSRYYADIAAGKPHHVAWKAEKGRRRAILDRRRGTADRARERLRLDAEWHEKYDNPDAPHRGVQRIEDEEGVDQDIETDVIDKSGKDVPIAPKTTVSGMSRKEKSEFRQFPGDEDELYNKEKKAPTKRVRSVEHKKKKNQARNRARAFKRKFAQSRGKKNKQKRKDDEDEESSGVIEDGNDPKDPRGDSDKRDRRPGAGDTPLVASLGFEANGLNEETNGWTKVEVNLDTGAAVTAVPIELAKRLGEVKHDSNGTSYKTANGDQIEDEGGVELRGKDNYYNDLNIEGRVTDVHRVLLSGAQAAQSHHIALGQTGGVMIRRGTPAGLEYARFMKGLRQKYGKELTDVRVKKGIYLIDHWVQPFHRQLNQA